MANDKLDQPAEDRRASAKKLEASGWGLFFIWIGISFLADVGWGIGLLGVGVILLGIQAGRWYVGLPVEAIGLVMGVIFVVAALWELLELNLGEEPIPGGFMPVVSIVVGIALVISALLRKRQ